MYLPPTNPSLLLIPSRYKRRVYLPPPTPPPPNNLPTHRGADECPRRSSFPSYRASRPSAFSDGRLASRTHYSSTKRGTSQGRSSVSCLPLEGKVARPLRAERGVAPIQRAAAALRAAGRIKLCHFDQAKRVEKSPPYSKYVTFPSSSTVPFVHVTV